MYKVRTDQPFELRILRGEQVFVMAHMYALGKRWVSLFQVADTMYMYYIVYRLSKVF